MSEFFTKLFASDFMPHGFCFLGLSVSRSIVQSHGAQSWASRIEGGGATFYVALPALS